MKKYERAVIRANISASRIVAFKTTCSIFCNVCGEKITNDSFGYLDNYVAINKKWEYGTKYDGETHKINICSSCYDNLLETLKIPVRAD